MAIISVIYDSHAFIDIRTNFLNPTSGQESTHLSSFGPKYSYMVATLLYIKGTLVVR